LLAQAKSYLALKTQAASLLRRIKEGLIIVQKIDFMLFCLATVAAAELALFAIAATDPLTKGSALKRDRCTSLCELSNSLAQAFRHYNRGRLCKAGAILAGLPSLSTVLYLRGLLHVRQENGARAAKLFDMVAGAHPCRPDTEMTFCILRPAAIAGRFAFCAGA
jgi:hypothetical protein